MNEKVLKCNKCEGNLFQVVKNGKKEWIECSGCYSREAR